MRAKVHKIFHRDFLGAHRYTTASGGIVRPAGGVLRTALSATQPRGDATLPLRLAPLTYPFVYFAYGKALKCRASPSTKSAVPYRQYRVLTQRRERRNYGS